MSHSNCRSEPGYSIDRREFAPSFIILDEEQQQSADDAHYQEPLEQPQVETVEEFEQMDQVEDQFATMTLEEDQLMDELNNDLFFDDSIQTSVPNEGDPSPNDDHFAFDDGPGDHG